MKSINYALIFIFSAVLTVACGGGGGGGGAGAGAVGTEAVSAATISNNVIALTAAFAPVAF
jgi:hypothetical protein